jgi:hypothetical protein
VVPPSGKKLTYVNIPAKKHGASSAHTIHRFLVFHRKSTTFLKQLVKKIREVELKIGEKRRQFSAKVNNFQDY